MFGGDNKVFRSILSLLTWKQLTEESIAHQEIARIGLPGFVDGLGAGYLISAPAKLVSA